MGAKGTSNKEKNELAKVIKDGVVSIFNNGNDNILKILDGYYKGYLNVIQEREKALKDVKTEEEYNKAIERFDSDKQEIIDARDRAYDENNKNTNRTFLNIVVSFIAIGCGIGGVLGYSNSKQNSKNLLPK